MASHNYLIHRLNHKIASELPYEGLVVDLGCGTCPYKNYVLRRGARYLGVDWNNCRHDTSKVDVFASLVVPLPFTDGFADTVVAFQVAEHLSEPLHFLRECHRILRPRGRLFLTVPFLWRVHEAPHDFFRYTRYGLEHLLCQAGFSEVEVRENGGFWHSWVLSFNYYTQQRFRNTWQRCLLNPLWRTGQLLAPLLDRRYPAAESAVSYTVLATKPATTVDQNGKDQA